MWYIVLLVGYPTIAIGDPRSKVKVIELPWTSSQDQTDMIHCGPSINSSHLCEGKKFYSQDTGRKDVTLLRAVQRNKLISHGGMWVVHQCNSRIENIGVCPRFLCTDTVSDSAVLTYCGIRSITQCSNSQVFRHCGVEFRQDTANSASAGTTDLAVPL